MLFAIFLVKCRRQRQDSERFKLSFAWQYQNSKAYERNRYSRTFLVIALVKQKISNRLKSWSSSFADILLHYGARSSRAEMFWSSKCDDGTCSAVPVAMPNGSFKAFDALRTTLRFFHKLIPGIAEKEEKEWFANRNFVNQIC